MSARNQGFEFGMEPDLLEEPEFCGLCAHGIGMDAKSAFSGFELSTSFGVAYGSAEALGRLEALAAELGADHLALLGSEPALPANAKIGRRPAATRSGSSQPLWLEPLDRGCVDWRQRARQHWKLDAIDHEATEAFGPCRFAKNIDGQAFCARLALGASSKELSALAASELSMEAARLLLESELSELGIGWAWLRLERWREPDLQMGFFNPGIFSEARLASLEIGEAWSLAAQERQSLLLSFLPGLSRL